MVLTVTKREKERRVSQCHNNTLIPIPIHRVSGDKLHLWLRFRSEAPDGLLVWAGEGRGTGFIGGAGSLLGPPPGDSLTLGLQDGRLSLSYNLGSGFAHLTYNNTGRLDDGQWHTVRLSRCVLV